MSTVNRPPVSLRKIVTTMKNQGDKIAVVVGSVTDDHRVLDVPKLNICALRFSSTARARISKAGGRCYTFDELALLRPKGTKCVLLRGSKNREVVRFIAFHLLQYLHYWQIKHFGAKGVKHGHAKYAKLVTMHMLIHLRPYVGSPKFKGKKFEKARGKR